MHQCCHKLKMGPSEGFVLVAVAVLSACGSMYTASAAAVEQSMIIGGRLTDITEAPFTVQIFESLGNDTYRSCGGSVIGKVHVLTAGHCVQGSVIANLFVVYAESFFDPFTTRKRGVTKVHVHPRYKTIPGTDGRSTNAWDVAVLLVDETIPVIPIKIAPSSPTHVPQGKTLTIAGWGKTEANATTGASELFSSTFTVLSHFECRRRFKNRYLEDSEFCVTETSTHAICNGDSGGPVYDSKTKTQYGVVSWNACGVNGIGVEADLTEPSVSSFLKPFIPPATE